MQEMELELHVGDSIRIGERILTVIDTDGPEMSVRIDSIDGLPIPEDDATAKLRLLRSSSD